MSDQDSARYSGSCACGSVTFQIQGDALAVRQCWCGHCQKLATGGPTHNVVFMADHIAVTGAVASNAHVADSGNELTWFFCAGCGTQLFGRSSEWPDMRVVRLGSIDQPHKLEPTMAIWTSGAPNWARFDPAMEQYPREASQTPPQD